MINSSIWINFVLFSFLFSAPVSLSDIEKMASNFINQKTFEIKEPISTLQLAEYSNMTIVNFHPSGFVLTSNDNQLIPVLAYSLNKNFDILEIPIHLEMTLSKYEIEIDQLLQNNIIDNENLYLWLNLLRNKESEEAARNVDPLLTAEWDQGPSFNLQCPYDNNGPGNHAVVGCVAVGMGQIMHYWQQPQTGIGSHSYTHPNYGLIEADFENTNYSFSNMTDLTGNFEVQQLLFHAGVSVEMDYGPDGLRLMEEGLTAREALEKLISEDDGEAVRQVAMIDVKGNVATHTGSKCIYAAGHQIGKNYSVQANLMEKETVWPAMAKAFDKTEGDLADRMMAALEAAEAEGGDIRGKQSAAMLIVTGTPTGVPWKDVVMDIRVDDHPEPLKELKRLIRIQRAYLHANKGDHYLETDEIEKALVEYEKASGFYPENPELPYWSAITLAGKGNLDEALLIFEDVFRREPRLRTLTPRLVNSGLLPNDVQLIKKIMSVGN